MRKRLAIFKWKVTLGYSIIGVPGLILVISKTVQDILFTIGFNIGLRWIYPAGILILWFVGWLWHRLGLWSDEVSYGFDGVEYFDKNLKKIIPNETELEQGR